MAPRRRLALVVLPVLAAQAALALGAAALCGLRTERGDHPLTRLRPPRQALTYWSDYHSLGYPVPWIEFREDWFRNRQSGEARIIVVAFLGCNWLVPPCLFALALALPPLLAAELRRTRVRRAERTPRPRWHRLLLLPICAAVCGLTIALIDVITNPQNIYRNGVGHVPFERPPGRWLRESKTDSTGVSYLADPSPVLELREWRGKQWPEERSHTHRYEVDRLLHEWEMRSWRTAWGFALGLTVAAGLLQPWRRGPAGTPAQPSNSAPAVKSPS
jgi:hypothetical protein